MANIPKNLAAFLSFFFLLLGFSLAIGGQRGPVSGLEQRLGSGGKRTSPHLLGKPREAQRCWLSYEMLASCRENQVGTGSS